MKGLKVGITVVGGRMDAQDALWSSGIGQNIAYLAMLLQRLAQVETVFLVTCPPGEGEGHALSEIFGLPTLPFTAALDTLDLLIELGARACSSADAERLRARGGRLVSYMAGNVMALNFEELARGAPHGDSAMQVGFDAVWITPQHWKMCRSYAQITRSAKVELAPHVWSPHCLVQEAFSRRLNPYFRAPEGGAWRLGVFEPNIHAARTFHLPFMAAEEAYRLRPELIAEIILFNTWRLREDPHFKEVVAATDLGRDKKVFVEHRHPLVAMMGRNVDAVVAHQWENGFSHLYWEVLYLGWPLVHNSAAFQEVGYYYPSFDPQAGGRALVEGLEGHAARSLEIRERERETLWSFSIDNPKVQASYGALIESAMA